jgi:probable addiction module antidote protein
MTIRKTHVSKTPIRKKKEVLTRFDSADYLKTDKDIIAYLQVCMEEAGDDPAFLAHALGVVARAHGMTQLARDTGLTREALYKTLSPSGNPNLSTLLKVLNALNVKLSVKAA